MYDHTRRDWSHSELMAFIEELDLMPTPIREDHESGVEDGACQCDSDQLFAQERSRHVAIARYVRQRQRAIERHFRDNRPAVSFLPALALWSKRSAARVYDLVQTKLVEATAIFLVSVGVSGFAYCGYEHVTAQRREVEAAIPMVRPVAPSPISVPCSNLA